MGRIPYGLQFGLYEREMTLEKYVALGINGKKAHITLTLALTPNSIPGSNT